MTQMGSPSKDIDNRKQSRQNLKNVIRKPILHNDVRGEDQQFDNVWEDTIHGRAPEEEDDYGHENLGVASQKSEGMGVTNIQLNHNGAFNAQQNNSVYSQASFKSPNHRQVQKRPLSKSSA